jgi:hypothetical protein
LRCIGFVHNTNCFCENTGGDDLKKLVFVFNKGKTTRIFDRYGFYRKHNYLSAPLETILQLAQIRRSNFEYQAAPAPFFSPDYPHSKIVSELFNEIKGNPAIPGLGEA